MAKSKETAKDTLSVKKLNRQLIEHRLEEALADLKAVAGKKKFQQSIRKAGKLINSRFPKKTFDKLRKAKETTSYQSAEHVGDSQSINDLP